MEMGRHEYERLLFFEGAREKAAEEYLRNPLDAENLIRWGGALLELAQFQVGPRSVEMLRDAEAKLEEALKISPKSASALWCLGNAHTSHGFLLPEADKANELFKKASLCFEEALQEEPSNELFKKAVEMSCKAPDLHQELHKQLNEQATAGSTATHSAASKAQKKSGNSDLKYDILGWIVLAVGVSFWVKTALQNQPAT